MARKHFLQNRAIGAAVLCVFASAAAQNCTGSSSWLCTQNEGCCWDESDGECKTFCPIDSPFVELSYTIGEVPGNGEITSMAATIIGTVEGAMTALLQDNAEVDELRIGELLEENCGSAPLCGTPNQTLIITEENMIGFHECCPLNETSKTDTCQVQDPVKSCRYAATVEPVCEDEILCDLLNPLLEISNITFQKTEEDICCDTCRCYGDPRCTSFNGTQDIWALCDARGPVSASNNRCKIQESVCATQKDHENNQCMWLTDEKFDESSSVGKYGSQCVPNNMSSASTLLMYSADTYKFVPGQTDRGVINQVTLTLDDVIYSMSAESCVADGRAAWNIDGPVSLLPDYFRRVEFDRPSTDSINVLWVVSDPKTNILTKIRCVAVFYNDINDYGQARINVEDIVEPNPDYLTTRTNPEGFCVTGSLEKTGTTNVTELVESDSGYCTKNGGQGDVALARAVCQEALSSVSTVDCFETFCSQYWFFYYDSLDDCVEDATENFGEVLCRITTDTNERFRQCMDDLDDFDLESVLATYLYPFVNNTYVECTPVEDLPTAASNCSNGLALQYQPVFNGEWETFIIFPADVRVCGDGATFEYNEENKALFLNPIRLIQCSTAATCTGSLCKQTPGVNATLRFERGTLAPNRPPIDPPAIFQPTPEPTMEPTDSPTTYTPTIDSPAPTDSPSASPTYSPTKNPTKSPSPSPTQPTAPTEPTLPTYKPTPSPSTETPTRTETPTKKPKGWGKVTKTPTSEPPSIVPTEPLTDIPTTSPTKSPSKNPTVSPSYSPSKAPTYWPSGSPTYWPSGSPTYWPTTETPTSSPTYAPVAAINITGAPTPKGGGWIGRRVLKAQPNKAGVKSVVLDRKLQDALTIVGTAFITFDSVEAAQAYAQSTTECEEFVQNYNSNQSKIGVAEECHLKQVEETRGVTLGYDPSGAAITSEGVTAAGVVGIVFGCLCAVYLLLLARKHALGPKKSTDII